MDIQNIILQEGVQEGTVILYNHKGSVVVLGDRISRGAWT